MFILHIVPRNTPQFGVNHRGQAVPSGLVALASGSQQISHFRRFLRIHLARLEKIIIPVAVSRFYLRP
jgi:hypothetical protein